MKVFDNGWRTFAVRAVALGGVVFGAVRLAVARDGVAGGPARSYVTVAGTITGASRPQPTLTFEFQRRERGTATTLCSQNVDARLDAHGSFSVPVPISRPESTCPEDMFDGRDVWVRTSVDGTAVGEWAPINPVPYAHFANQAGELSQRSGWQRTGADRYVFSVYLRDSEVPVCIEGFMTYDIGVPSAVATTRDVLFSGAIDVMTRPDDPEYWNHTGHWTATFSAYTHSGYNLTVCSLPTRTGLPTDPDAATTPSVCYAPNSTNLPNYIQIRRPEGNSARLNVIVPCTRQMNRLSINIDAFVRPSN